MRRNHRFAGSHDQRTGPAARNPDRECRSVHPGTAALRNARTRLPRGRRLPASGLSGRPLRPHVLRPPWRRLERRGLFRRDGEACRIPVPRHGDSGTPVLRGMPRFGAGRKAGHTAGVLPRTFGIGMVREDSRQDVLPEADALCLAVVRKWRGSAASLPPSGRVANPDVPNGQSAMPPGLLVDTEQWAARAAAVLGGDFAKQVEAYFRAKWEQLCLRRATLGAAVELPLSDIDQVFIAIAAARTAESPLPALRSIDDELTAAAQATGTANCAKVLALVDRPGRRLIAARETLANVESRLDSAAAALSAFVNQMERHRDTIRGLASRDEAGQPTFRDLSQQEAAWYREYCKVCLCENVYRRLLGCVDEIRAATKQLAVELNLLGRRLEGIEELLGCVPRDRSIIESAGIEFFRPAGRDETIRPASEPLAQGFRGSPANQPQHQTLQPPQGRRQIARPIPDGLARRSRPFPRRRPRRKRNKRFVAGRTVARRSLEGCRSPTAGAAGAAAGSWP